MRNPKEPRKEEPFPVQLPQVDGKVRAQAMLQDSAAVLVTKHGTPGITGVIAKIPPVCPFVLKVPRIPSSSKRTFSPTANRRTGTPVFTPEPIISNRILGACSHSRSRTKGHNGKAKSHQDQDSENEPGGTCVDHYIPYPFLCIDVCHLS